MRVWQFGTKTLCFYSWYTKKVQFTFGEQFLQSVPGQGAADLQPLGHDGGRDEFVVGNLFVQLVVGGLIEEHQVVELIPHFSLGPLLLRVKETRLAMETVATKGQGWVCVNINQVSPSSWLCLQTCWLGPCPSWTSRRPSSCLVWEAVKIQTRVNRELQSHCNYESDLLTRDDLSHRNGIALMGEIKQLQDRLMSC